MPTVFRTFAEHQPITVIANAVRALALGPAALPIGHTVAGESALALAWSTGILVVFAPLAVRAYRRNN
jgi:hypothetical protein